MAIKPNTLLNAAIDQGLINAERVADLTTKSRRDRVPLVDLVCLQARLPVSALYQALAQNKGIPFISNALYLDEAAMRRLPTALLQRASVAVIKHNEESRLLVCDPQDNASIETARRLVGAPLPLALTEPETLANAISQWQRRQPNADVTLQRLESQDYVALLDDVFRRAYLSRASDIHIQPEEDGYRLRYRVDGRLQEATHPLSMHEGTGLISRIKVLSGLDIAETRDTQDGSLTYSIASSIPTDIRVATMPTRFGERATLRLLGDKQQVLTLEDVGMGNELLSEFRAAIARPHGIILITGPTGSGKSSTLYAALAELMTPDINVLTVEDPIERIVNGASQVQVSSKIGFAGTLRAFLRHDPDVVMVGEIRDFDTADVALKAAMTGHLVFSTLHTNSAVSAITRLADLGVPHFMTAATLVGAIAQRLVRRLCRHCCAARDPNDMEIALLQLTAPYPKLYHPNGCPACASTGYRGRIGIFEAFWLSQHLSTRVAAGVTETELIQEYSQFRSLWDDGKNKILTGLTTVQEVMRVAPPGGM